MWRLPNADPRRPIMYWSRRFNVQSCSDSRALLENFVNDATLKLTPTGPPHLSRKNREKPRFILCCCHPGDIRTPQATHLGCNLWKQFLEVPVSVGFSPQNCYLNAQQMPHQSFLYRILQDICQTLSWPSLYTQTLVAVIRVEFSFSYVSPPLSWIDDPVTPFTHLSFLLPSCAPFNPFSFSPLIFCSVILQVSRADPHGHSGNHHHVHRHHDNTTENAVVFEKRQQAMGLYTVINCLRFQTCL